MIKANFSAYSKYVTDSLHQWDLNQVLQVTGLNLTAAPEVHFSNANMDRAIVRQSTMTNHVVTVDIPNSLLQAPLRIYAHVGIYEGSTFKVVEVVEIPVIARKRPMDYQIEDTDEEVYSFKRLENLIGQKADSRVVNARIDNIVANANKTDGNSELVDIRVGNDGTVYASAGTAVRAVSDSVSRVKTIVNEVSDRYNLTVEDWAYGSLPNGADSNSWTFAIKTKTYIDGAVTRIIAEADAMFACICYRSGAYVGTYTVGDYWFTDVFIEDVFAQMDGTCDIRLVAQKYGNYEQEPIELDMYKNIKCITTPVEKLSVLGDSISTFSGVVPSGYASQYPAGDVTSFDKTWVGKLLEKSNMRLEALNAWAGSRVTNTGNLASGSHAVNSDRLNGLGDPDKIIFFMGVNDLFQTNPPEVGDIPDYTTVEVDSFDTTKFASAYLYVLMKLRSAYPDAKLYCCAPPDITRDISGPYWKNENGLSKQSQAEIIEQCCRIVGAQFIDLRTTKANYYNYSKYAYDGDLHPNEAGMEEIADCIFRHIS